MAQELSKRSIEKTLRTVGYTITDAKKFVGRLPSHWFDSSGMVIEGAIEADSVENGPVERLLARRI